jgi:hypothetical protein
MIIIPLIMPDATAQKKFSCPSCGGESQWNPAKKALVCPFSPFAPPPGFDRSQRNPMHQPQPLKN